MVEVQSMAEILGSGFVGQVTRDQGRIGDDVWGRVARGATGHGII